MASRRQPSGSAVPYAERIPAHRDNINNRIEAALKRNREAIPTFIVELDVKTNAWYSSPAPTYYQKGQKTHLQEPVIESLVPVDRFKIQLLVRRTIRTGQVQKEEFRIHASNGEIRIVESETGILLDDNQQISKIIVTTRDITEQKRIQEAANPSAQRISAIINNRSGIVAFLDKRARVVFTAPSTTNMLGYTEEELVGQNALLLVHPEDRAYARRSFRDMLTKPGNTITTHHRIRHKDGSWRIIEGCGTNLLDDSAVGYIVMSYRDTTKQETADLKNAYLAALVESTDDAVIGKTLDGTIMTWNKAAEMIYGYSPSEVAGRSISIIMPPDKPHELSEVFARIKKGETVDWYETERITKSGKRINVSVRISPAYLPTGELIGASAIARYDHHHPKERDLLFTELQNARAELQTLRGMLPICAWCKKVRDDDGYWGQIESYFESHSQMQFTHGICPECIAKYHQRADKNITDVEGL